jgi:leucine dehydrogenase
MNVFEKMENMEHEQLMFFNDNKTGLKGIIAIHNSVLGPALGGTRLWHYTNEQEALNDVMRLSRGMSFKSAISGIHLGGGKAVIIDNPKATKGEAYWRSYGKFVDNLGGKYITAEDVGTNTQFIEYISLETKHVAGKPSYLGGGGDPSPVTAYGVYLGMKAAQKQLSGSDSLMGKKIGVQGVGNVGQYLIDHLYKEGADIFISDINELNLKSVSSKYKVEVVAPKDIYGIDMDIYAPCALGASINDDTIPMLKCSVIAGAANNQLAEEDRHGDILKDKGIIYAPDFLINAGGVINCYIETVGYDRERAMIATEKIYSQTCAVLEYASKQNKNSQEVALEIAMNRIEDIGNIRQRR